MTTDIRPIYSRKKITLSRLSIHSILIVFCLACVLPILLVLSISVSNDMDITKYGYALIPRSLDFAAYKYILADPSEILNAYFITIVVTILGTILSMWLTATLAYAISRKDYKYANITSFYIFITMLYHGGLVPTYILITRGLHLKDTLLVLFVPNLVIPWFVLLMKGFLQNIPVSIVESAKIDGASELHIFVRIILPLSKPGLATVALFTVLGYWNDWFSSLLYIESPKLVSLQYLLYRIMSSIEYLTSDIASQYVDLNVNKIPTLSARMAMCILAAGPILCVFPFFQKYFVKGLTVGSIKG